MNLAGIVRAPEWVRNYDPSMLRQDLPAGLTVGAMLIPQAMAYALLAGLPPEVGLYAATIPLIVYALLGTSHQLAVGPVAIVSLLTASALAPLVEEGSTAYLEAAALLALMVGAIHIALGLARLGHLVNLLSHSVLVGFTAAAAIIIGFSQVKHILGISIPRQDRFVDTVIEVGRALDGTHWPTVALAAAGIASIFALRAWLPRVPAALVVVIASIAASELLDLGSRGVSVVGDIPDALPAFGLPGLDASLMGSLAATAVVITLVGFMESFAVAKVYARRDSTELDANRELIALGGSNAAAGLFGGYPVTGGFSRTAVNAAAGARTPLASIVSALIVLATIVLFTPLFSALPNATLGAVIIAAVVGLVDVGEMRHIARVKRSDLIGLSIAFLATLLLGIELGILVAVVASMLVVFARMSTPHSAVLGHVPGTTSYRNVSRFPEAETLPGFHIVRIDASISFANAARVKQILIDAAEGVSEAPRVLILDASGVNDIDMTGVEMLHDTLTELERRGVQLHLTDVKGPVRDVLHRAELWERLDGRFHPSTHDAVLALSNPLDPSVSAGLLAVDERRDPKSTVSLHLEDTRPS